MKQLHKGKMADCKVCTPEQKKKRRDRFEIKAVRKVHGLEGNVRRQMAEEIGEDELSKDCKFQLMQHYGIIAARIDRRVTKPNWMEESTWRTLRQQFHNATKGLLPARTRFTMKPADAVQRPSLSPFVTRPPKDRETRRFPNRAQQHLVSAEVLPWKNQRPVRPTLPQRG